MLQTILSENGPLASGWPGFQARENQCQLAQNIENALQDGHSLILEAPTGTGKTLAYLLPALLSHKRILLSVGNRTLQDHLWWGEYQKLRATLPDLRSVYLLKGCENYLCLYQTQLSLEAGDPLLSRHWQAIQGWQQQTRTGEVQTITIESDQMVLLRNKITLSADRCLGKGCAHFEQCYFQKARSKAAEAELLLVNHTLLLSDNSLFEKGMGALLPEVDAVIVDEAHQLPELLMRSNLAMVDGYRVMRWLKSLRRLLADQDSLFPEIPRLLKQFETLWQRIREQLRQKNNAEGPLTVSAKSFQPLISLWQVLSNQLEQLHQSQVDVSEWQQQLQQWIAALQSTQSDTGLIYCDSRDDQFKLFSASLQSPFASLNQQNVNWLFLSATLMVENSFDYFRQALSLPEIESYRCEDALDYPNRALLCVPSQLPAPDDDEFYPYWIELVLELSEGMDGGMLLLFSSHAALQTCAELLRGRTSRSCFVYHCDSNRQALLQQFRQDGQGLLLATGSFWEGIDVQGPALSCVAIDKLPFIPPNDMLAMIWRQLALEKQQNWFNDFMVPQAVTRLRQGVGRLLRSREDCGIVVLGDRRVLSKPYGRRFLASLPEMPLLESVAEASAGLSKLQQANVNLNSNLR